MSNKASKRTSKGKRNKHKNEHMRWGKVDSGIGGESHKVSKARARDKRFKARSERRTKKNGD